MTDFGENYYRLKRSALIFAAILFLFCIPGVRANSLEFAGINISGVSFDFLLLMLFVASFYYFLSFLIVWWIEARANLLAIEKGEAALQRIIEAAILELRDSRSDLQPIMQQAGDALADRKLNGFISSISSQEGMDEYRRSVAKSISSDTQNFWNVDSPELFNLVAAVLQRPEKHFPASSQLKIQATLQNDLMEAARKDVHGVVERASFAASEDYWKGVLFALEKLQSDLAEMRAQTIEKINGYDGRMSAHEAALNTLNGKVRFLHSARRFKFFVLDLGVVIALFATMAAHYVGKYYGFLPSLIPMG